MEVKEEEMEKFLLCREELMREHCAGREPSKGTLCWKGTK